MPLPPSVKLVSFIPFIPRFHSSLIITIFQRKFRPNYNIGRIAEGDGTRGKEIQVQCFPLYSLLLALNQTRIDFLSLDVEGDEENVLRTIPYKKVDIRMMTVEYVHGAGGTDSIINFIGQNGYSQLIQISRRDNLANDVIFRKNNFAYWKM